MSLCGRELKIIEKIRETGAVDLKVRSHLRDNYDAIHESVITYVASESDLKLSNRELIDKLDDICFRYMIENTIDWDYRVNE